MRNRWNSSGLFSVIVAAFLAATLAWSADLELGVGHVTLLPVPGAAGKMKVRYTPGLVTAEWVGSNLRVYGQSVGSGVITVEWPSGRVDEYIVRVFSRDPKIVIAELRALLGDLDDVYFKSAGGRVVAFGEIHTQQEKIKFDRVMKDYSEVFDMVKTDEVLIDIAVTLVEVEHRSGSGAGLLDFDSLPGLQVTGTVPIKPSGAPEVSVGFNLTSDVFNALHGMIESGRAKIIARTRVVTVNGKQATMTAGGEIPVTVVSGTGVGSGTEYKNYGIRMEVTPELRSSKEIMMKLHIESSEPVGTVTRDNPLTSRSVDVNVAVKQDSSLVVAGLFNTVTSSATRTGCLIPLFGTRSAERKREILAIVTPKAAGELGIKNFKMIKERDTEE